MVFWLYGRMLGFIHPRVIQAVGWIILIAALYWPYKTVVRGALTGNDFRSFIFTELKQAFYEDFLGENARWFFLGLFLVFIGSAILRWRKRVKQLEEENERLWLALREEERD